MRGFASQVGNWVHMQPEVWNRSKNAPYMPFLFSTDIVRLCANFSLQYRYRILALRKISGIVALGIGLRFVSHFPILQYLALVRALYAYSRVVVYPELKSGGECKNFSPAQSCGSFRDSKPTFFRHFKELTQKPCPRACQCVGAWQRIAPKHVC